MIRLFTLFLIVTIGLFTPRSLDAQTTTSGQQSVSNARIIRGTVTDVKNVPLVGASVVIKGVAGGVATGINGEFAMSIPSSKTTLIVSYIGMITKSVPISTQTTINVKLDFSNQEIDEVMVIGAYGGVQKKSDMVGSAFQVNADKIKTLPSARIDNILEGLVPGMTIEPNSDSGTARTRYEIRVRGNTSLGASNEPLWIIDGVPMYTGDRTNQVTGMSYSVSPLSFIDSKDIESITVLKDATETAIYGADGSNGIILVTTKSGIKGKRSINVGLKYGMSTINESTKFKVLNSSQYMMLSREAWNNAGRDMREFPYQDNDMNSYSTTNTDWYDQFYGVGSNVEANVAISGGGDIVNNYLSINYFRQDQTVKGNTQDRISARLNSTINLSKRLTADFKANVSYNVNQLFSASRDYYNFLPIVSPYDEDGVTFRLKNKKMMRVDLDAGDIDPWTKQPVSNSKSILWPMEYSFFNSIAEREENDNRQRAFSAISSLKLNYEIMKGLSISATLSVDYKGMFEDMYDAGSNLSGMTTRRLTKKEDPEQKMLFTPAGYSTRAQANSLFWNNLEQINYSKVLGKHKIGAMAGFELKSKESNGVRSTGNGFPNDQIKEVEYAQEKKGSSYASTVRSMSYFAQASYSYDSRYYLLANFRSDGNSDFGEYSKWANFASFGVSWNVHNENFFDVDFMDKLKVKFSYGSAGNSRVGGAISYGVYTTGSSNSYENNLGAIMSEIPNPGLTWETTLKSNYGIDMRLFKRLEIGVEYYSHMTKDLLSELYVSRTIGQSKVWRNVGRVRNRGVELTLSSDNIVTRDFSWRTDFILAHNKNKIVELYNGTMVSFGGTAWIEGQDMDAFMLIRWAGVDPRDGAPLWYDLEGNVTRSYSYQNRVPYKTSRPTVSGSFNNTFRWKNLSLYVAAIYSIGGYVHSSLALYGLSDGKDIMSQNQSVDALDRWRKPGDLAANPRNIAENKMQSTLYNTRYLYNKSYVRLSNVALTYAFPQKLCTKMRLGAASVSFIADNLAIWSPYDYNNRNSYKTVMGGYPSERTFSLSLSITL